MTDARVRPQSRPVLNLQNRHRVLGAALCALLASTSLAACGRSGLRSLGQATPDGSPIGTGDGAAGSTGSAGHAGGTGTDAGGGGTAGRVDGGGTAGRIDGGGGTGVDAGMDVPPGKIPVALAVAPSFLTLPIGGSDAFTATVTYSDGTKADVTASATWTSDMQMVASVRAGRVTAISVGTAVVTAKSGTLSAAAKVLVMSSISLVSIAFDPPAATLPVGGSLNVRVIGTFSDGSTQDVTAMAKIGTVGANNVAVVDVTGHVMALQAGSQGLIAVVAGLQTTMTVRVTAAMVVKLSVLPPVGTAGVGTTTAFTADATLSDGTHADVTATAMWGLQDATVGSIDQRGVATGKLAGKTIVTAGFLGQIGTATLIVTGATLKALQIDPVDPDVGVGVEVDFTATGLYSDGTRVDLTSQVTWASSAPVALPIDGGGHAFSKSVGTSVVTATSGMLTAESTVTVSAASLQSLAV